MDEGWATTFELLYSRSLMSKDSADEFYKKERINGWIHDENASVDLPIIIPGENFSGRALGPNEYGKPSLAYFAVKDLLGDDMFRKCLHAFMERWHGKHPLPWDFFHENIYFPCLIGKKITFPAVLTKAMKGYKTFNLETIAPKRKL
jgi:hypothetical protein